MIIAWRTIHIHLLSVFADHVIAITHRQGTVKSASDPQLQSLIAQCMEDGRIGQLGLLVPHLVVCNCFQ